MVDSTTFEDEYLHWPNLKTMTLRRETRSAGTVEDEISGIRASSNVIRSTYGLLELQPNQVGFIIPIKLLTNLTLPRVDDVLFEVASASITSSTPSYKVDQFKLVKMETQAVILANQKTRF